MMEAKVTNINENPLTDEEKDIIDSIGSDNVDYCVAAVLSHRHPDKEIEYIESEEAFEIDGKWLEPNFEMIPDPPKELMEVDEGYGWIAEVVLTLELLFELND